MSEMQQGCLPEVVAIPLKNGGDVPSGPQDSQNSRDLDTSAVAEFLQYLETAGPVRRLLGWKAVSTRARETEFALNMIAEEYRDKLESYRQMVRRYQEEAVRAYASYQALLELTKRVDITDPQPDSVWQDHIAHTINRVTAIILEKFRRENDADTQRHSRKEI